MAIIFSPIDGTELHGPYTPRPRHAFLMLHAGDAAAVERDMVAQVRAALDRLGFTAIAATEVPGTGDFLGKIIELIRGCGFGVAVYSDQTPPKTLGNIFFEVGISHLLGKPVQLLIAGADPTPSDFVRTEWLRYDATDPDRNRRELEARFQAIEALGEYYCKLGEVGLAADAIDYEMTFERFKQAVLISDNPEARGHIATIADLLRQPLSASDSMENHRQRLRETISHFVALLPHSG